MGYNAKCSVCGRRYWQESSGLAKFSGVAGAAEEMSQSALFGAGVKLIRAGAKAASGKKDICPDCRRAGYGDGNSGGGSGGSSAAAAEEAAEEAARREEQKRKEAAHKEAIRNIREFEFDEDDDGFVKSAHRFADDYCDCHPGLLADGDYKKEYKKRAARALKELKDTNPEHYEKFNSIWEEAVATMKGRLKKRLIITAALEGVSALAVAIVLVSSSGKAKDFFIGLFLGLFFPGMCISFIPQMSAFHKSKTDEE